MSTMDVIEQVARWIDEAERVTVLTGAGISTDSGIPDFRGPKGVWTKNPEAEKMATLQNWVADPEMRKRGWKQRIESFPRRAEPNVGHHSLVELERRQKLHLLIMKKQHLLSEQSMKSQNQDALLTLRHSTIILFNFP